MSNIEISFDTLYREAGHIVKNFQDIKLIYSGTKSSAVNFIFDLEQSTNVTEIEKCMKFAIDLRANIFFVTISDKKTEIESILSKYKYIPIGRATCVEIDHKNYIAKENNELLDYNVKRVDSLLSLQDWCSVCDNAFEMYDGDALKTFQTAASYLFKEKSSHQLYVLYNKLQKPISISLLYLPEDKLLKAGHYFWGTKADDRKQGAMTFMADKMISIAKQQGYHSSVAQCYDVSLEIAKKAGFKEEGTVFELFINDPLIK